LRLVLFLERLFDAAPSIEDSQDDRVLVPNRERNGYAAFESDYSQPRPDVVASGSALRKRN
jgi:hypothetical protein